MINRLMKIIAIKCSS